MFVVPYPPRTHLQQAGSCLPEGREGDKKIRSVRVPLEQRDLGADRRLH
jgi:hypothetical protein